MMFEQVWRARTIFAAAVLGYAALEAACNAADPDSAAPVAAFTVALNRTTVRLGHPVDVTFSFTLTGPQRLDQNYWVMVHFVDEAGRVVWIEDHRPPTPTSEWQTGRRVEYTRTMFVPDSLSAGNIELQVGMYSPDTQQRLRLGGGKQDRAYPGGTLKLEPADTPEFSEGWYDKEGASGSPVHWRWTKRQATLTFRNPRADAVLYLDVASAELFPEAVHVTVSLSGVAIDQFDVAPKGRVLRRTRAEARQLGNTETVRVTISVDKTFVPARIASGGDVRELGIRVFNAAIEPVS